MRKHGGRAIAIRAGLGAACCAAAAALTAGVALADEPVLGSALLSGKVNAVELVLYAILVGAVTFAVLSAISLIGTRNRVEIENKALRHQVADLKATADRAEALIAGEDQVLVAWGAPGSPPLVSGNLIEATGAPSERAGFIAFGNWLQPESAGRLDRAIESLRDHGVAFLTGVDTRAGRLIEVQGRTVGGLAVARFRDLTGDRLARAEAEARSRLLLAEVSATRAMIAAAPMPMWARDPEGQLAWVNAAYAAAVEATGDADAVARGLELLDSTVRKLVATRHASDPIFLKRLPAIVAGSRRIFDVADIASPSGSAGIAVDVTAIEAAEAALRREIDFNARTLDQLATAVAIFGSDRRLRSYNAAYRALFALEPAFLDSHPEENAVLDRLREARRLPEQADFRSWRADLLAAYRSVETREHWWHLPDGQTLRVIANPNPQGGMTWVYENVTERLDLESRYNALIQVQGETLDNLAEGVAVFGSDGRLRLHNPSFAAILGLDIATLKGEPHVAAIVRACRRPGDDESIWTRFTACVAGLDENRASLSGRMDRSDGRVVDYTTVPLPDGQTMVTFVDVSDSVKVERALVERNEALEAADRLKTAFIGHVSYELRSPLTNIIGFTQLMADTRVGPLNDRQREYVGYVMSSGTALLAIVNDILDLATVDAGIMELDLGEVDAATIVAAAVDGLRDRLQEARVRIDTDIPPDIGTFVADEKRIRQVLFNLLANAVAFSAEDGRVAVSARRDGDMIELAVTDNGPGIAPDFVASAFDRFASQPRGGARGGVGLGLSIVKSFIGLHGGTVTIESGEGKGVRVVCRLPVKPGLAAAAAE